MYSKISHRTSNKIANMAFFCAILVVSIHVTRAVSMDSGAWWVFALGSETISRMAVPFFFLCSGFFLAAHYGENGWWLKEIKKRLRTIVVPYLLFVVAFYVAQKFLIVASNVIHHRQAFLNVSFNDSFLSVFGFIPWGLPCLDVLWYCRCLLILVCISPCLFWVLRGKFGRVWISAAFLLWLGFMPWTGGDKSRLEMFFIYTFSIEGLFFFALGAFMCLHEFRWDANLMNRRIVWCVAIMLVAVRILTLRWGCLFSHYFVRMAIPFCMMSAWWLVPDKKLLGPITGAAFPVYLVHKFFLLPQGRGLSPLAPISIWAYFCVLITVVVCSLAATAIIRRVSPAAARIIFGGR